MYALRRWRHRVLLMAFASLYNLSNIRTMIKDARCACEVGATRAFTIKHPLRDTTRNADL
jgi:hypothetical protein